MLLELILTGWFRGSLEVRLDGAPLTTARRSAWYGLASEFRLDGRTHRLRVTGLGRRRYALVCGTRTLAEAEPAGFLGTAYRIRLYEAPAALGELRLERDGWTLGRYVLKAGEEPVAHARRRGFLRQWVEFETVAPEAAAPRTAPSGSGEGPPSAAWPVREALFCALVVQGQLETSAAMAAT